MTATLSGHQLRAVYTDADWSQDIYFTILGEPRDFTGSTFSLALVPLSGVKRADAFEITSESGGLICDDNRVGIRVPEDVMKDVVPQDYQIALREHQADGDIEVLAVCDRLPINRGLSSVVANPALNIPTPAGGPGGSITINVGPRGIQVVSGGGVPPKARLIAFDDTLTQLGADNVEDALIKLTVLVRDGVPLWTFNPGLLGAI